VKTAAQNGRVTVSWNTALAGPEPLRSYRIYAGERLLATIPFRPQTTLAPLTHTLAASEVGEAAVRVLASEQPPAS
jgi:hypothetical protein